jgi:hypothetical protein
MRKAWLPIGLAVLVIVAAGAVSVTAWAVVALIGLVPAPAPGGHEMTPADFASIAVAGSTLILATATVLLAVFTFSTVEQGRQEHKLAMESQTIAAIMPIYDKWRSEFSVIRNRLVRGELNLETIDDSPAGYELRSYLGYLELICILVVTGRVQFDVADKVWPTAFKDAYQAAKPYVDRRRKAKPFFAEYLQQFVEEQERKGVERSPDGHRVPK